MTLLLKNQDMPGLVSTDECIEAIESAFQYCLSEEARERAIECGRKARTVLASTRTELLDFLLGGDG